MKIKSQKKIFCFKDLLIVTISLLFLEFFFAKPALAYLDPGTGSYVFQILIAGILGIIVTISAYWKKIVIFFKKKRKSSDENDKQPQST